MRERKFIRLRVDMYEDTKFKIIDRMPERDVIHYVWTRLLALCGKVNLNGELYMSKNIPYTIETLAIEFNREAAEVSLALDTFIKLEMVELMAGGVYVVKNFVKHQNIKTEKTAKTATEKVSEDMVPSSKESAENNNTNAHLENYNNKVKAPINNVISLNHIDINQEVDTNQAGSINFSSNINKEVLIDVNTSNIDAIKSVKNTNCIEEAASDKLDTTAQKTDQKNLDAHSKVTETSEKKMKANKCRTTKKKVTSVISFDEDNNEEIMELSSGEPKLGKSDILINSFSF
ncbi:replisome organizer region-containing protein [Clostridium sp. DL-VIII]|uniref:phage replisome organizer N-terminal domain-containing protein n=1 Tax=Clostridium sp. DL-VIII TaxID=641107 RepID=UPI00023B0892|nr:phage replisome organizer N-terminal domain-containing protein [Clostridium sp. DL-VIII]EHJ01165.1 replisome organizer region-containing protein [Clostridium sp. DL-VIII]